MREKILKQKPNTSFTDLKFYIHYIQQFEDIKVTATIKLYEVLAALCAV